MTTFLFRLRSILLHVGLLIIVSANTVIAQDDATEVYVPTPDTVVQAMLDMAGIQPGDYLIDLGSGDGRIPIAAARRDAFGHGIEIDASLVAKARQNAEAAGVSQRTAFIHGDIFKRKIHQANVITMYLFPELMEKLKPRLLDKLKPGTRVVSHLFDMDGWPADQKFTIKPDFQRYLSNIPMTDTLRGLSQLITLNSRAPGNLFPEHEIFMWIIPADAGGHWRWQIGSDRFNASIDQTYQQLDLSVFSGDLTYNTIESNMRGRRISFVIRRGDVRYNFSGTLRGDRIKGIVQIHRGTDTHVYPWQATRSKENQ